jgi:hypothetical protein
VFRLKGQPHILALHAVSFAGAVGAESDGFFLMDLCSGSLLDAMRAHACALPLEVVLTAFGCVCSAVMAMHHQDPPIAHRHAPRVVCCLHPLPQCCVEAPAQRAQARHLLILSIAHRAQSP